METKTDTTTTPAQTTQQPPVRRRLTTKTTPAKNDVLATIDTGVIHLSTNEDLEEKKLSLGNMHLQEWYDDDNEEYDANVAQRAEDRDQRGARLTTKDECVHQSTSN
eukprot:6237020-Amphidinium_carterae.1